MKEKLLLATSIGLGALLGGGALLHHNQEQTRQIETLTAENQRMWGQINLLWANGCFVQAELDEALQGQTDITPDVNGIPQCKKWSQKWEQEIFSRPPANPSPTPAPTPSGGK